MRRVCGRAERGDPDMRQPLAGCGNSDGAVRTAVLRGRSMRIRCRMAAALRWLARGVSSLTIAACLTTASCAARGSRAGSGDGGLVTEDAGSSLDCPKPTMPPENVIGTWRIHGADVTWSPPADVAGCTTLEFQVDAADENYVRHLLTRATKMSFDGLPLNGQRICVSVAAVGGGVVGPSKRICIDLPVPPLCPDSTLISRRADGVYLEWTVDSVRDPILVPMAYVYPITSFVVELPNGSTLVAPSPDLRWLRIGNEADLSGFVWVRAVSAVGPSDRCLAEESVPLSSRWRLAGFLPRAFGEHFLIARGDHALIGGHSLMLAGSWKTTYVESIPLLSDGSIGTPRELPLKQPALGSATVDLTPRSSQALLVSTGGLSEQLAPVDDVVAASEDATGWTRVGTLPATRYYHSSLAALGRLYVFGGESPNQPTADVSSACIDGFGNLCGEWRVEAPLRSERLWPAVVTDGRFVYSVGGWGSHGALNEVLVSAVDPTSGQLSAWVPGASLPGLVSRSSAVLAFGKLYVFSTDEARQLYVGTLDPNSGAVLSWKTDDAFRFPGARYSSPAILMNGRLMFCGGWTIYGLSVNDCEVAAIDPASGDLINTPSP